MLPVTYCCCYLPLPTLTHQLEVVVHSGVLLLPTVGFSYPMLCITNHPVGLVQCECHPKKLKRWGQDLTYHYLICYLLPCYLLLPTVDVPYLYSSTGGSSPPWSYSLTYQLELVLLITTIT